MSAVETKAYRVGVDWGFRQDHTAVCLVEETKEGALIVRLLVKFPTGGRVKPEVIVNAIRDMYADVTQNGAEIISFASDATGMGESPTEKLQEAIPDARIEAFVFNNTKKRELVGKVKILHAYGRLRFAHRMGDRVYNQTIEELKREMRQLQAKVIKEDASNPEIEVFKTGQHDDLFTALALAVKDVNIRRDYESGNLSPVLAEDKTWVKTPLSETPEMPSPVFF